MCKSCRHWTYISSMFCSKTQTWLRETKSATHPVRIISASRPSSSAYRLCSSSARNREWDVRDYSNIHGLRKPHRAKTPFTSRITFVPSVWHNPPLNILNATNVKTHPGELRCIVPHTLDAINPGFLYITRPVLQIQVLWSRRSAYMRQIEFNAYIIKVFWYSIFHHD